MQQCRLIRFLAPALVVESEAYLDALPTAGYAVITGAGHALTAPQWRADFAGQVLAFFAGL